MIKLKCVGCKTVRTITLEEAQNIPNISVPVCPRCGMPELAIQAKSRRSGVDLRSIFRDK
jgi:hypothetical protein